MDGDPFGGAVDDLSELVLEGLEEGAGVGLGKELVEGVIDLEDNLRPEVDVLGEEGAEEGDSVEGVLFVDVVEALVLEFVLDVAENLEEQLSVGGEVGGGELKLAKVGQVGDFVEENFPGGLGLLEVEVYVD